jgi:hypothetical protein
VPVLEVASVGDLAGGDLQRGEQGCSAVPDESWLARSAGLAPAARSAGSGPGPAAGTSRPRRPSGNRLTFSRPAFPLARPRGWPCSGESSVPRIAACHGPQPPTVPDAARMAAKPKVGLDKNSKLAIEEPPYEIEP